MAAPWKCHAPYEAARELVRTQVRAALRTLRELPKEKRLPDESVLCLRLHPDMLAKSYDPQGIFAQVRDLENVGSRTYRIRPEDVAPTKRIKRQLEQKIAEVTGALFLCAAPIKGFNDCFGLWINQRHV